MTVLRDTGSGQTHIHTHGWTVKVLWTVVLQHYQNNGLVVYAVIMD